MKQDAFSALQLRPELADNLADLGFASMTPIQSRSLPPILEGKDVIAQGQTGSGKTAAFGLGLLNQLKVERFRTQALVLCPTRELADQVAREIRRLARGIHNIKVLTLCGGMPFGPQIGSLEHGAHIVVGTPGRIDEHLRKGSLKVEEVSMLVLDEADRMLDMGFQEVLDAIVEPLPTARQTLLFSATYPPEIQAIARRVMQSPILIQVESEHTDATIKQLLYRVAGTPVGQSGGEGETARTLAVRALIEHYRPDSMLVFCNTKIETQALADTLRDAGYSAVALHGDLEQRDRDQTLVQFANRSVSILVATDVAARGLDIDSIDLVLNYHIAHDAEVHTHRVGRTGRAGGSGVAITLFEAREQHKVDKLQAFLDKTFDLLGELPPPPRNSTLPPAAMTTLQIDAGKKQKVRPGDILGAITGEGGIPGDQVGKIQIFDQFAYVALRQQVAEHALRQLNSNKLKGRSVRARRLSA
ncbi:ATP-dependent RNA helicase DbpA [Allohahella sp. A8]|uniref:ATP-dependent RNA helicase DbpA n=1 Tax=Allohahella sp. A8 TaxID=3141461 RepID=UPI000C0B5233|nr:ATP-dependent RNA helicase DbpA [Hahellaceae bacterium]|tara:strand:- start:7942 stop:9360 length:1419 start_codon:yes stop_codon:yes gene_type:complete